MQNSIAIPIPTPTPTPTPTTISDWMNPGILQTDYHISTSTQAKLRSKKAIPYSKIGSMVFYSRTLIDQWLLDHKVV